MVRIKSVYTVIPSKPTPNGRFWMSESDQYMAWTHAPTIYIFKPTIPLDTSLSILSLKNSLSEVLVLYYPLSGRLRWIEGSRLELDCNAQGAQLSEAYSESKIDDLGEFAPNDSIKQLVPSVDYSTPIEDLPLLLVQFTRFSCGGISLGFGISHIVADGLAAISFINTWAKLASGQPLGDDYVTPFHDRTILRPEHPLKPPHFDHDEYKPPPLVIGCSNAAEERKKESCVALIKATKEQVEGLKKKANVENNNHLNMSMKRPYSRYEAIAGHMWKCACKARKGESNQPTRVHIGVDFRSRVKPPLPQGYFGNAVIPTVTEACEFQDVASKPISYGAQKIREATQKMTGEYIQSALIFLASQNDISFIRTSYHTLACIEAPFWGNPNLALVSWITLPVYDLDFGWGKPIYMGPGALNTDGKSFIMPSPSGDGSVILALRLQTQYMDDFKKFFYDDM